MLFRAHAPSKENSAQIQDGYCMVFHGRPKQVDSRPSTIKDNAQQLSFGHMESAGD